MWRGFRQICTLSARANIFYRRSKTCSEFPFNFPGCDWMNVRVECIAAANGPLTKMNVCSMAKHIERILDGTIRF